MHSILNPNSCYQEVFKSITHFQKGEGNLSSVLSTDNPCGLALALCFIYEYGWFLFFVLWLKGGLMFTAFSTVSSTSQVFINVSLPCSGGILFYLALQYSEPLECEKVITPKMHCSQDSCHHHPSCSDFWRL